MIARSCHPRNSENLKKKKIMVQACLGKKGNPISRAKRVEGRLKPTDRCLIGANP
jgi:hypothetical protein